MWLFLSLSLPRASRSGWIDPSTADSDKKVVSFVDGGSYELVMSDEFEVEGRCFEDGCDDAWTSYDKSDDDMSSQGGGSLHFYNSSNVQTSEGFLNVSTNIGKTAWIGYNSFKKEYESLEKYYKVRFQAALIDAHA